MFIRKNWIPLSVFLIAIVMVGLYVLQTRSPEKAPLKIYKTTEVEKPMQPQAPVGETSQGRHFHADGTWHEGPHDVPVPETEVAFDPQMVPPLSETQEGGIPLRTVSIPDGIDKDWASLSPEDLATAIKVIDEHRVEVPEGYYYKRKSDGTALLDENGYPILHKRNEPFFTIHWVQGFRPTPEQYAEYKKLSKKYHEIRANTVSSPELDRLSAQMDEMRQTYVGPVPTIGKSWAIEAEDFDLKAFLSRYEGLSKELRREAYRKAGLGYLIDW